MILAIDARSLVEPYPTGVTTYTRRFVDTLHDTARDHFRSCLLITNGSRSLPRTAYPDDTWFVPVHLPVSSKALMLATLTGTRLKAHHEADVLWMPNINSRLPIRAPYALTVHDLSFLDHPQWYSWSSRLWHAGMRYSSLVEDSRVIIPVSAYTRHRFDVHFPNYAGSIHVINPLVRNDTHITERTDRISMTTSKPYVLFLGTVEERKNVLGFVRALELLGTDAPDGVIVGKMGHLSKPTRRALAASRITIKPYVSDTERDSLIAGARALVWPSFYEGFGYPPIEALARHIPVIVSYRTSLPEFMKQRALYINPYNAQEIAMAIRIVSARTLPRDDGYDSDPDSVVRLVRSLTSLCT